MFRLLVLFCLCCFNSIAQPNGYSTSNAHSHNDYEQKKPFWEAYNYGFGSIEADIFLLPGYDNLLVAHTLAELQISKRTLDSLYLIPLVNCIRKNNGYPYKDTSKSLQILIDVKTEAVPTLDKLISTISKYPELVSNKKVTFAVSGNRPPAGLFNTYPGFIGFDGEMNTEYDSAAMNKIILMSSNLRAFTNWNGNNNISAYDSILLAGIVNKYHALKKPVRFWNAPDGPGSWRTLMDLNVDFLNTDHIAGISKFLSTDSSLTGQKNIPLNSRKSELYSKCSCNDSARQANMQAIAYHKQRCLTSASEYYDKALKFAPPKKASSAEKNIILSFAPVLLTIPGEPFRLKDVVAVMHPGAPWIAYHLFWEDDIDFPDDNDPCDHEIIWVRLNREKTAIRDYFTYFHGRILQAEKRDVDFANKNQHKAVCMVQWGKHGTMPYHWKELSIVSDPKDIEYTYMKSQGVSDTMNLYKYNKGIYKKLSTIGRQSINSPLASNWPKKFIGSFNDFINFSGQVKTSHFLNEKKFMLLSCLNNAVINRYFLRYNFAVKTEWPEQICEDGLIH